MWSELNWEPSNFKVHLTGQLSTSLNSSLQLSDKGWTAGAESLLQLGLSIHGAANMAKSNTRREVIVIAFCQAEDMFRSVNAANNLNIQNSGISFGMSSNR